MIARQHLDLVGRHGVHGTLFVRGAVAQGQREHAAGTEHGGELAEGAGPLPGGDVLPDRTGQHEVEGQTGAEDNGEVGQGVVGPTDARPWVPAPSLLAHGRRRFRRHHFVAERGQPSGITPAARTDAEDGRGRGGQQLLQ